MQNCFQFKDQNILQHGYSVHAHYRKILKSIETKDFSHYKIPDFIFSTKELFSMETMECYHIFHDCGKPFTLQIDENGKRHYPNHAVVSSNIFKHCFPWSGDVVSELIRNDMTFHSGNNEQIQELIKSKNRKFVNSLLLTSFAEIYANCEMFGGTNSVNFKKKYNRLCEISSFLK
jgi:hypothetical protein